MEIISFGVKINNMTKQRFGKLVRDKVPEIVRSEGNMPNIRTMDTDEFRTELLYKLIEEAEELRKAGEYDEADRAGLMEQTSDILEVLYAIFKEFNLDEGDIERVRRTKLEQKGGFKDKVFLESIISS